jgi:DNA invertase Pin-like site-specific DNA recombinase
VSLPASKVAAASDRGGKRLVAYTRVSTARQGASGLGLEAQRSAVHAYAAATGGVIVAEYVEVESGAKAERPQLAAALAACRLHRATLVIAKLDRLARNVALIANLTEAGVDFVACDMPHANRFTIHIFAALAEHEREMISQRTKAALAAAKARGVRLGNPNGGAALRAGCKEAAQKAGAARREEAAQRAAAVAPLLRQLAAEGVRAPADVALALNRKGVPSPSGGAFWYAQSARRAMAATAAEREAP